MKFPFSIIANWRAYIAEFLGTFVFILISLGAVLSDSLLGEIGILGVAAAGGFSYMVMVFATVSVSGGHLNPAISMALWFGGKLAVLDLVFYTLAQFLAGFAAVFILLFIFPVGAGDFSLGAALLPDITLQKVVIAETVFAAILTFVYFATMIDRRGPTSFGPIALGLAVMSAILAAAPVSGGIINPAKALAPAVISGTYQELLAWIVGPYAGSLFGLVYQFLYLRKGK